MDFLSHFLAQAVAESISMHGVFLEVQGFGAFIKGDPAIGKSELALELISRGHRLIADDVVDFFRISPERIEGRCPALLQDFLEVRGLGVLNIRAMFGDNSVKPSKPLDLIIQLEMADKLALDSLDRLNIKALHEEVLGVSISKVQIPIAAGRNIAVLVEVAIRNHMLLLRGINAVSYTHLNNKYMLTPRGIFELKYFFGSSVATDSGGTASATAIRALIKKLVEQENPKKPFSDNQITELLAKQGIIVARRTIAKYRESLGIEPASLRKTL